MIVSEVTTLFRQYIDEPDQTFVTDAMIVSMLQAAYSEFRWMVMEYDNTVYSAEVTITLSTQATYDLGDAASAVRVFGADANLTHPRLMKIVGLYSVSNNMINTPMEPVTGPQALSQISGGYYLDGTVMRFSERRSGDLTLRYFPEPIAAGAAAATVGYVDWSSGTDFIDNLTMFHDLIALIASKQYFIMDNAVNESLLGQLDIRQRDLVRYLTSREQDGSQYVQRVYNGYELGS
tara:strand:+ start:125 stop:829 length:705 start_codon:yes stop_codon:yes gene_type:complete